MKERISLYQTSLLLTITIGGTAVLFLPRKIIEISERDGWITIILLFASGLLTAVLYTLLIRRMGQDNLIEFSKKILGKFITIPLAIILFIYFALLAGVVIRETAEILIINYLPLTPLWFINSTMLLVGGLFVYYGLETMARTAEILFYLFLGLFLLIIFPMIDELNPQLIRPILGAGINPVLRGILPGLLFYSELFIVLIWAPAIKKRKQVYKPLFSALFIASFLLLMTIVFLIMFFGGPMADELTLPIVTLVSYTEKLEVLERLDPFLIYFWVGAGLGKAVYFIYGSVYVGHKLMKLKAYYPLLSLALPLIFYFSFSFFQNITQLTDFIFKNVPYFLCIQILYPMILYVISLIRGIKGEG